MLRRCSLISAAALACLLAVAAMPASATVLMTEDVPAFGVKRYGQPAAEAGYGIAELMGARMIRHHTGRDADFSWAVDIDPFVADVRRHGFEPYLTLSYRRRYRGERDPTFLGVPTPAELGAWCGEAARRYRGRVRHYGVFNEPNYFGDGMTPQLYHRLFRACRDAIAAAAPGANVYYGEIAADQDAGDPCAWLASSLAAGGPTLADGLAIHTYQWTLPPERRVAGRCRGIGRLADWNELVGTLAGDDEGLRTPRGAPVPLLVTEHGYCAPHGECPPHSSGSGTLNRLDEARRADYAARAFRWARRHGVSVFSYYHLFNQADEPGRWDSGIVAQRDATGRIAAPAPSVYALGAATGGSARPPAELGVGGQLLDPSFRVPWIASLAGAPEGAAPAARR